MNKYIKLNKMLGYVPSTNDVLNSMGLRKNDSTLLLEGLAIFGAGCLVGAGMALLFAPRAGTELRTDLSNRAGQFKEQIAQKVPQLGFGEKPQNGIGNPMSSSQIKI